MQRQPQTASARKEKQRMYEESKKKTNIGNIYQEMLDGEAAVNAAKELEKNSNWIQKINELSESEDEENNSTEYHGSNLEVLKKGRTAFNDGLMMPETTGMNDEEKEEALETFKKKKKHASTTKISRTSKIHV